MLKHVLMCLVLIKIKKDYVMEYLVIELTEEQLNIIKKYRDECIEKLKDPDLDSWEYIYYEGEIMECNLMLDKKKAHLDTRHLED